MKRFYTAIVRRRRLVLAVFALAAVLSVFAVRQVKVDYDINDYLPPESPSTTAIEVMNGAFTGGIPNMRVMVRDVTVPQALEYKEKLAAIDGVSSVAWLDDSLDVTVPLQMQDTATVESYYKDGCALFTVTVEDEKRLEAVAAVRELIGEGNALEGAAVSTAVATNSTVTEVAKIAAIAVVYVLFILILTTDSWAEPLLVLTGLGAAILLNNGTNLIFGTISFVTNAAGSILQLAVSLDYSVFLIHRFAECRAENPDASPEECMVDALCRSTGSILSSGLTTVIGFLALVLMQFQIGPDLGLALAKGVVLSLVTVFTFMPALTLAAYQWMDKTHHRPLLPSFDKFGRFVARIMLPMALVLVILMVPSYLASNSNQYYYGAAHMFGENTRLGADTAAIEETFGRSDTYVVLVPEGDTATQQKLSDALHAIPEVTGILSYVDNAGASVPPEFVPGDTLGLLVSGGYTRMVLTVDADTEGDGAFALVERVRATVQQYYPDNYYLAGQGVSTYDLMDTITADMVKVNLLAIGAVFLILLLMKRQLLLPIILVLSIETAIWINLAIPYFRGQYVFYIAYLIISSVQLGATVDYAILFSDRYQEFRETLGRKEAVAATVSAVTTSVSTTGSAMAVVGFLMGAISTNQLLGQLGNFLGVGSLVSLAIVLSALPGFLYLADPLIIKKEKTAEGGLTEMKHRFVRRVSALALAGCLLAGSSLPAFAAASAAKEEVIYANLTASGAVTGVYAVNSFSVQAGDTVADHGSYTAVRNMTTSDAVEQSGDTVTVHVAEDGKLYYEGTMDAATALPWVVKLTYTLDGAEISPDELGGKSGALSIRLQVSRNPDCTGSFFDDYALQVTMSLDTGLARNISAPGATVANVGSKKQLSYILLPGADSDVTVTADVTDFAMDAVSLNGVRLNLNLDLGDMDLTGMLEQLQSGSVQLDDGANALADGIAQVQAGIDTLNGNSGALTGGSARVRAALTQMQTALNGISASTDELNTLLDASTQIRDGIARLDEGAAQLEQQVSFEAYKAILKENGLDLDVVKDGNAKAIQQLQGMVWMMPQLKDVILLLQGSTANIDAMQTYLDTVNGGIAQLHEGSSTLNGSYGEFDAGVRQLAGVLTGMLGNLSVLTDGVNQLAAQYVQLDDGLNAYTDGVAQLKAGVAQLAEGASQLTGGTGELRSSVSDIDMGAQLDGLLNSLSGGGEVQSFTSAENTEVGAVQFALQTTAITAPAPAAQPEPAAVTLTFWQKLLKLFGLYKG
ncbi:MAG: MMPL family transporter [Faecalibacterium sp.]